MKQTLPILRQHWMLLAAGLATGCISAVWWVWGWEIGNYGGGWGSALLFGSQLGMLAVSWRLAHNDDAAALTTGQRLTVIALVNAAMLMVVMSTAAVAAIYFNPAVLSLRSFVLLPLGIWLPFGAYAFALAYHRGKLR
jgi:hypothetical protein